YLRFIFWPVDLAGDYDYNAIPVAHISNFDAWAGLLLIAGIAAAALWYGRRNRAICFWILFAYIAFLPTSNWIVPISVLMAEPFLSLPMVGIAIALAIAFGSIQNVRIKRLIGAGGLVTAVLLCNSLDYIRRNDFTFFGNMVRVVPNSAKARLNYGYALLEAGR